jgi:hypothetical protein
MTRSGTRKIGAVVMVALVFAAVGGVALRNVKNQRSIRAASKALEDLQVDRFSANLEHDAFIALINQSATGALVQSASSENQPLLKRFAHTDALLYIIRTTCPACPRNFPALYRLDSLAPGSISIIAIDSPGDIDAYAREHDLRLPITRIPDVEITYGLPVYSTPITMALINGELKLLATGRIDQRKEEELARYVLSKSEQ